MAIAHGKSKYTYDDYAKLPEGERVELIGGEFLVSPAPRTRHQDVLREIVLRLSQRVEHSDLGRVYFAPTDVVLSSHDVVQPDILFISRDRLSIITEANVQGAPDFIIEILSPGNEGRDMVVKKTLYEKHGVKEYWIVDPDARTVSTYDLCSGGLALRVNYGMNDVVQSTILPGFALPLSEVFAPEKDRSQTA